MVARSMFWVALTACVSVVGLLSGDEAPKPGVAAEQLVGEWKQLVTLHKKDDTLMVMTIRRNGVCRLDALDRASREQPQGPDVRLPGVGTWKMDGQKLVITWEKWSPAYQRPIEQVDRYQIEKATETELVWRLIGVDEPLEQVELTRWVRFEGWWLAKGLLQLQGVAEPAAAADGGGGRPE